MNRPSSIWVLVGSVVGVAMAFGKLPVLHPAARGLAQAAAAIETKTANWVLDTLFNEPGNTSLIIAALAGVMAPGLTALGLAAIARGTGQLRQLASGALVLVVVAGVFAADLPLGTVIPMLLLVGAIVGMVFTAAETIVAVPAAAVAAMMAVTWLPDIYNRAVTSRGVTDWAAEHVAVINQVWFDGIEATTAGHVAIAFAVLPFVATATWLWRGALGAN